MTASTQPNSTSFVNTLRSARATDAAELFTQLSQRSFSTLSRDQALLQELTEVVAVGPFDVIHEAALTTNERRYVVNAVDAFIDAIAMHVNFFDRTVNIAEPVYDDSAMYLANVNAARCTQLFRIVGQFDDWTHERLFYTSVLHDTDRNTLRTLSFVHALRRDGVLQDEQCRQLAVAAARTTPERIQAAIVSSRISKFITGLRQAIEHEFSRHLNQLGIVAVFDQLRRNRPAEEILARTRILREHFGDSYKVRAVKRAVDSRSYDTVQKFVDEWSNDFLSANEEEVFRYAVRSLDPQVIACFQQQYAAIPSETRKTVITELLLDAKQEEARGAQSKCFPMLRQMIDLGEPTVHVAERLVQHMSAGSQQFLRELVAEELISLRELTTDLSHLLHAEVEELVLLGLPMTALFELYHDKYNNNPDATAQEAEAFLHIVERLYVLEENNVFATTNPDEFRTLFTSRAFSQLVQSKIQVTRSRLDAILNEASSRAASRSLL